MRYIVYIDQKQISGVIDSLGGAKEFAADYTKNQPLLRIEGYQSNAPIMKWKYDPQDNDWVAVKGE
ncbi:hypothetical protein M1B72_14865 [Geomonas paludis]|uniref:Uncharacterized protein n=1 Tax=Geomonas paludis TaxID=2740185 RepID=A0ABY4LAE4_9BACT|nr:hypothetical protein [Geomonas paludis]UPU34724.1 hypothetical protein M1B72_14865 [Geomonas paludis]